MKRAGELIERFAARRPLAVRLAEAVSLAVLADPRLLRRARLDLVPEADPGTEADLWMSPLVQTRSPDGLVFAAEVGEELRTRLAESPARLEKAWGITKKMHRHLTPALRLEEEIAFLSLTETDPRAAARIEELLRSALAAVVMGEMRGLAHWAARALPKLPSRVRVTQAARLLEAGAHLRLGGAARPLRNSQEILDSPWMAPADLPRVPVGVRLFPDAIELDARPDPSGQHLLLPQTDPLLVELSWQDPASGQREARQLTFRKGETQKIHAPVHDLRLRTVLGEVYDLRAAGTAPREVQDWIIDFSEELARHRPFFGRAEERLRIGRVIREDVSESRNAGRLILVTGETGAGKSALLAQFVVGPETPHHFFRRGQELEDLGRAERSLLGQIVRRFPELANMANHQGLQEVLDSLTGRGLVTRETGPLVLVLDGIDEARSDDASDGLLGLLAQRRISDGVVILASAAPDQERDLPRPMDHIPLTDAEPGLREYWSHYIGKESAESLAQLSAGSFGVAQVLRAWISLEGRGSLGGERGTLAAIWESLASQVGSEARDHWLGCLAAAAEPLPSSLLSSIASRDFSQSALRQLTRVRESGKELLYELREEILREFIDAQVDLTDHRLELAERALAAIFEGSSTEQARRYGLRHAFEHWIAVGDPERARRLFLRADFLIVFCRAFGVPTLRREYRRWLTVMEVAAKREEQGKFGSIRAQLISVFNAITLEEALLTRDPAALPSILFNSLRGAGWAPEVISRTLALPSGDPHLRLLFAFEGELKRTGPIRHRGKVTGCAFIDLDGPAVLSWSTDGTLRIWDVTDGELKAVLTGHTAEITACVLLEEERAVSASRDCTLRLWDTRAGTLVQTLWGHEGDVLGVLALHENMVVSWSTDRTIRIWDLTEGREVMVLRGHEGAVSACAVTPSQQYLVSGSEDATVRIWDISSGALVRTERGHTGPITCVAAPEGDFVYSGSLDRTLRAWSLDGKQESQIREGHKMGILGCAVSPDARILATCSYDRTVRLWRLPHGRAESVHLLATLAGHEGAVLSCAFSSEEELVSCSADRTVRIWDLETGETDDILPGHEAAVRSFALRSSQESRPRAPHPLTNLIASASDDRTTRIWDAQTPGGKTVLDGDNATLFCLPFQDRQRVLTFSRLGDLRLYPVDDPVPGWIGSPSMSVGGGILTPDERRLILWSRGLVDGRVRFTVWDLAERREVADFYAHQAPILACAVTPDGTTLLTASLDGTVRNFSLVNLMEMPAIEEASPVSALAASFLPPSPASPRSFALRGTWDGTVVLWLPDVTVGESRFTGHTDRVLACAIAPAGRRAVSASADHTLRLWDLEKRSTVAVLKGHEAEVTGCAFTREGLRIVSCSKDGRLGLWDGASGQFIAFTQKHDDWVTAFAIDEDAGIVYSASEDQTVRAWDLATGEPRGVVYGVSPFRSLAVVRGGVYAGDEAGNLWPLESVAAPTAAP